jgi:hypothetical protein
MFCALYTLLYLVEVILNTVYKVQALEEYI